MAVRRVLRAGHPLLRTPADPVRESRRRTLAFDRLVESLFSTMRDRDGVGLAAPQIQESSRVFVYRIQPNPRYPNVETTGEPRALINPRITDCSGARNVDWEGCLSLPDLRGRVPRHEWIEIEATNRSGERVRERIEGFEARVIQHELDHLEGRLYVDRMEETESLSFTEEYRRYHLDSPGSESGES